MGNKEQLFFNSIETIFPQLIDAFEAAGPAHTLHEKAIHAYTIHSFKLLRSVSQAENPLAALEEALIENWKIITGNLLCYTALPNHSVTKIWCEAAKVVASHKPHSKNGEPANPLLFLIPSLQCVESVHEDYPCLIPVRNQANEWDMDLVHILSTHILNDAGTHLLPLRALLVLDENAGIPTIYNPYIDDKTEPSSVEMNSSEIYRLAQHCFESQTIYESKQRLDALTLDNGNLLGQLNLLRQKMRENSVHGVGKELTAGQFFDKNIYDFLAWYDQMDNHGKEPQEVRDFIDKVRGFTAPSVKAFDKDLIVKIINAADKLPSEIRDYINLLKPLVKMDQPNPDQLEQARQVIYDVLSKLGFISKPTSTLVTPIPPTLAGSLTKLRKFAFKKNNQEDPNTCLKILGDQLEKLIKKHAPILSKIGISNDKKQLLVAEVVQSFKDAKALFKKKLINQEAFNGQDKLNLSRKLLSHFSLKLSFTHPQDFEVLERLSEEEIASICSDKEITDSLLNTQNAESLILFALTTSPAKLNALLGALSQSLLDGENKKLDRLTPLLIHLFSALNMEKCQGICEQIKQYFIKLCIQQPSRFSGFMRKLGSDRQIAILNSIREELPKFINTSSSFCKVYSLRILKDTPQKQALFDDMKERLPRLPKNIGEFTQLYNTLSPAHQTLIFPQGLKEKIDNIKNLNNFIKIYASLNPEEAANLLSVYKQNFPVWVKTSQNLLDLCKSLTQEQFNELLDIIPIDKLKKNRTPEQIYSALRKTYWHPIPLRPLSLLMSLTDPGKILSFESLLQTIEPIALEQLRLVNKAISPAKLSSVTEITSEHEEKLCEEERLFLRESREQIDSIFSSIETRLPTLNWDAVTTISNVLRFSSFQQREKVFHQFIFPQLGILADSAANWNILLTNLSPAQRETVNDFIYSNLVLSELFRGANDFIWGPLKFLNKGQRSQILKTLTNQLNLSIRSFSDLSNFISINMLSNEECRLVFDLLKTKMTQWTDKNAYKITAIFTHLDNEGCKEAFELLKEFIPQNIKYLGELVSISRYLSREQIEHITPKLAITYSSQHTTLAVLDRIKLHERESVIDKIFNFLPQAINTPEDFISFSSYLTPAQCYRLFMEVLPRFSSLEQANLILTELTQKLPKQTARIIFCSMLELFNTDQEKFITFCNNNQQFLSSILRSVDDVIFFMKRRMHFDIVLFLEAAKPMLAALNPSAVEYDDLIYRLEPGELKTLSKYLPALKDVIPIDLPGRNSQSFFGSKKRKAEGTQAAPDKRHCQEENPEIGTSYRFPPTEETPDGLYTSQPPMQALLDDLFPGIPMETDEESGLDFWSYNSIV